MKTFSKKLISLMLVALMLVAAMPMAAFADEVDGSEELQDLVTNVNATVTVDWDGQTYTGRYTVKSDYDGQNESTNKAALKATGLPNYDQYNVLSADLTDGVLTLTIEVKSGHKCSSKTIKAFEDETDDVNHILKCTICGEQTVEPHSYKVTSKGDDAGHNVKCTVCGHTAVIGHDDSGEKKTVTPKKEPTCTKAGAEEKTTYACGYTIGGETIDALGHDYVDGKCTRCGALDDENTSTYNVTIVYTKGGNVVENATAELTLKEITNLKKSNASNAKQILAKTNGASVDDDKIIDAYRGSINSCFSYMAIVGNEIEIGVTKNLSGDATANSDKVTVTVVDGSLTDTRELTVGKSYFNYDLALGNNNNKSLASVRITYEANGKTYTRTAKKGDSDAKVQAYDTQVELLWDAKQVTINFYRNAADGAEKVSTMTIRAGETIEGLPKLDGEYVSWYLESGELLQEGRSYDFVSTTMKAFPYAGGEVYLQIYKNGDTKTPVSNDPVNVTAKVQKNGIISASDLTKTIEKAVGKKNLKITGLFDFDGWEEYKSTKSTKAASSTIDVGTADNRTGVQFLYVMVNGGTSSNSKADSSNPKTGDNAMIGTAATVMAVAVIGLGATAVVLKKKEQF